VNVPAHRHRGRGVHSLACPAAALHVAILACTAHAVALTVAGMCWDGCSVSRELLEPGEAPPGAHASRAKLQPDTAAAAPPVGPPAAAPSSIVGVPAATSYEAAIGHYDGTWRGKRRGICGSGGLFPCVDRRAPPPLPPGARVHSAALATQAAACKRDGRMSRAALACQCPGFPNPPPSCFSRRG
jgi:hypothetical protein